MTCKNLLAPEHGDIEYIIEEHEREDTTVLQVFFMNIIFFNMNLENKKDISYTNY